MSTTTSPIEGVIFDRDDTLLEFDMPAIQALEARIMAIIPTVNPRAASQSYDTWDRPWPRSVDEEPAFWVDYWTAFCEQHQQPMSAIPDLCAAADDYYTIFRPFSDTGPAVAELHRRGFRLGVLTNFNLPNVARVLDHAGVPSHQFTALLSSAALGIKKPDPRTYQAAAAALGLAPEVCLFVDDRPEHLAGAERVGMQTILIDRTRTTPRSHAVIYTLTDLFPYLLEV